MKIIGHAGVRGLAPANTLTGIQKALDHNVDAIECDIRVSRDGVPLLYHDAVLVDPSGNRLVVADSTLADLQRHKPDLTTLEAALGLVNRQKPLYIDIKPRCDVQAVIRLIQHCFDRGWSYQDIVFASFDQRLLLAIRHAFPKAECLVLEAWSGVRARYRAQQLGTKVIGMNQRWLWRPFIRAVHRSGYQLFAYTVNNPRQARRWTKVGLAGVVTDFPDRMKHW